MEEDQEPPFGSGEHAHRPYERRVPNLIGNLGSQARSSAARGTSARSFTSQQSISAEALAAEQQQRLAAAQSKSSVKPAMKTNQIRIRVRGADGVQWTEAATNNPQETAKERKARKQKEARRAKNKDDPNYVLPSGGTPAADAADDQVV